MLRRNAIEAAFGFSMQTYTLVVAEMMALEHQLERARLDARPEEKLAFIE